ASYERDAREAVHVAHVHPAASGLVDGVPREALPELLEGDARLQARERGAEAVVHALAEAEGLRDLPVDVEAVGVAVLALVAIGGANEEEHACPLRHGPPVPLDVAHDGPRGVLRGRAVAQDLLDRAGKPRGI